METVNHQNKDTTDSRKHEVFFMLLCNHMLLEQLQCMLALIMQVPGNVLEEKSCSLLRNIPSISVSMLLVENAAQNVGK